MGQIYSQLSIEERNWIHRLLNEGSSLRQVAREVSIHEKRISNFEP